MKRKQSLQPPGYLLIYLILAINLHLLFPIKNIIGTYRILGVGFIVFGLLINLWADNLFKKEKTTVKPNEPPSKLITEGPFCFSRHPMYLGMVIILFGVFILLGSMVTIIFPIIFITLSNCLRCVFIFIIVSILLLVQYQGAM